MMYFLEESSRWTKTSLYVISFLKALQLSQVNLRIESDGINSLGFDWNFVQLNIDDPFI